MFPKEHGGFKCVRMLREYGLLNIKLKTKFSYAAVGFNKMQVFACLQ